MKKVFALLMMLAMVLACGCAMAVEVDGLNYELSGTTAAVAKYNTGNEYSGDIVIPAKITHNEITYEVTSIGNGAFYSCEALTSVTIPDGVTSIGEWAFEKCFSLTSVTIPGCVTSIGSNAFYNCTGLTSVTISEGVQTIGYQAFLGCDNLKSVTIPSSVKEVGNFVFNLCENLKTVTFAGAEPPNLTGNYLFNYCPNLTTIRVPMGSEGLYESRLEDQERYFTPDVKRKLLDDCTVVGYALPQPADLPQTGDSSSLALWGALLALAGAGMMVARKREA